MKHENLKPNVVGAPTLFIGVGGTGSDIVKRVAEMCRPEELENVNFACLDTNVNDLMSIQNSKAKIFYIQTSNTQTVGDYLDYDEDACKNWFPKNAVMYDKTVSEGAGQVRAISRLALNSTIKVGNINPLYDAIDDLFRKSGQELKQALRVVIASTASGGTGSGIILPLAMFIRDYVKYKYPNTAMIARSLILLPETLDSVISSNIERESQRRNAYATIKEINAFMMKGSGFFDVEESLHRYKNLHVDVTMPGTNELKSLSLLPFDFCFLVDGQDAEDSTQVSFGQYKKQAAQALYEQNIGPMQKNAFSVEDNIIKELANPGNLGRNRFGGIGASVMKYPYESIADYVAFKWALDNIGGEGEAAKWSRYDNEYQKRVADARKKGLSQAEMPTLGEVYTGALNAGQDKFSKDLRATYLMDATKSVRKYMNELQKYMHKAVMDNPAIKATSGAANNLSEEIDYKGDESMRGKGREHLDALRAYESMVRANAKKAAENAANAVFHNENKTINEKQSYMLETLLKNSFGEIAHPNAARYLLYLVQEEFKKKIRTTHSSLEDTVVPSLEQYSPDAHDEGAFDVKFTKKKKEASLDDLVAAEKGEGQDPNLLEKLSKYNTIYDAFNQFFPDYYDQITQFAHLTAELEAYQAGYAYVSELCKMYEKFFSTFKEKVSVLERRRADIVDELRFVKGDSVYNVCAKKEIMDELARATSAQSAEGGMLDSELNGQIFDAVKANVAFEEEIRLADIVENDKRIDIFDDIILGYFKNKVRTDVASVDMNIIEAMAMEKRLIERVKMREEQDAGTQLIDKVSVQDCERYIKDRISMGEKLAAPSIQRIRSEEPREVKGVAYNKSLDDMRQYRMDGMFNKGVSVQATDTVSKYELHFFNALYNLTPDKLNKFACPTTSETREKNAGLYFNAYQTYSKHLGPDSTKNMMISTHIDKRWDSVSVMPEMDLKYQSRVIMGIHQALIYGLVYGAIQYRNYSQAAGSKKVFRYENSEEQLQKLIVSNGTPCDEFYEILDSLYIDASVVEDIKKIVATKGHRDEVRNSNFADTTFAKAVSEFELEILHEGPASLFEIPLAYYNSLPNSQRYVGEINALLDAVVETLREQINYSESEDDAKYMLCNELKKQFILFIENFKKYESLNLGNPSSQNKVVEGVFRKIRSAYNNTAPEPADFEETLAELKAML